MEEDNVSDREIKKFEVIEDGYVFYNPERNKAIMHPVHKGDILYGHYITDSINNVYNPSYLYITKIKGEDWAGHIERRIVKEKKISKFEKNGMKLLIKI